MAPSSHRSSHPSIPTSPRFTGRASTVPSSRGIYKGTPPASPHPLTPKSPSPSGAPFSPDQVSALLPCVSQPHTPRMTPPSSPFHPNILIAPSSPAALIMADNRINNTINSSGNPAATSFVDLPTSPPGFATLGPHLTASHNINPDGPTSGHATPTTFSAFSPRTATISLDFSVAASPAASLAMHPSIATTTMTHTTTTAAESGINTEDLEKTIDSIMFDENLTRIGKITRYKELLTTTITAIGETRATTYMYMSTLAENVLDLERLFPTSPGFPEMEPVELALIGLDIIQGINDYETRSWDVRPLCEKGRYPEGLAMLCVMMQRVRWRWLPGSYQSSKLRREESRRLPYHCCSETNALLRDSFMTAERLLERLQKVIDGFDDNIDPARLAFLVRRMTFILDSFPPLEPDRDTARDQRIDSTRDEGRFKRIDIARYEAELAALHAVLRGIMEPMIDSLRERAARAVEVQALRQNGQAHSPSSVALPANAHDTTMANAVTGNAFASGSLAPFTNGAVNTPFAGVGVGVMHRGVGVGGVGALGRASANVEMEGETMAHRGAGVGDEEFGA
ncbi:hypothetical protein CALVIDRAFT_290097 [Calocera viscosa TUFC12733]|uniref:Uncharacterized protein n=1 Tax=Calocera viscosa (strain TUFC12733) TaxID=1330018 RepID=A0A167IQM1_CALVF|nr:hypothetical protein CALVIDRAFT_290097 [Calocera viscosa TUFC12733]